MQAWAATPAFARLRRALHQTEVRCVVIGGIALVTDAGEFDLLGEVAGIGGYAEALASSSTVGLFGHDVARLDCDGLGRTQCAAGRATVLLALEPLRAHRAAR
jgi:hypothetical protein